MSVRKPFWTMPWSSIEGSDAWLDVLAATYRVRARLAFVQGRLAGRFDRARACGYRGTRAQMPRLVRLDVRRTHPCLDPQRRDRRGPAKKWASIGLDPNKLDASQPEGDWGLRHGTTNVAIARWLVRAHAPKRALDLLIWPKKSPFAAVNCCPWRSCV